MRGSGQRSHKKIPVGNQRPIYHWLLATHHILLQVRVLFISFYYDFSFFLLVFSFGSLLSFLYFSSVFYLLFYVRLAYNYNKISWIHYVSTRPETKVIYIYIHKKVKDVEMVESELANGILSHTHVDPCSYFCFLVLKRTLFVCRNQSHFPFFLVNCFVCLKLPPPPSSLHGKEISKFGLVSWTNTEWKITLRVSLIHLLKLPIKSLLTLKV